MLTFIVPTTDESSGIDTVQQAIAWSPGAYGVVVVDGAGIEDVEVAGHITVVRRLTLGGSYQARNTGVRYSATEFVCFLDDGVRIEKFPSPLREDADRVCGATVVFSSPPRDSFEQWYQHNAFDTILFLERDKFIPTIALLISRRAFDHLGGFDPLLKSSGDVDFGNRASMDFRLEIEPEFVVVTDTRTREQLARKMRRQVYGRMQFWAERDGSIRQRLRSAAAAVANLFLLRGKPAAGNWSTRDRFGYRLVNARICLWKSHAYAIGAFASASRIRSLAAEANSAEVTPASAAAAVFR